MSKVLTEREDRTFVITINRPAVRNCCELPQGAMRTDKQAAIMGYGRPLEEGLRIEAEVGQTVLGSFDIIEGAQVFANRRKTTFKQDG